MDIFSTLKGRFTLFAVVLVLIAVTAAIITEKDMRTTSDNIVANLANRHKLQQYSHDIESDLFNSYRLLAIYLLNPSNENLALEVKSSITHAIKISEALVEHSFLGMRETPDNLIQLPFYLTQLKHDLSELLAVRINGFEQYPSLALSNLELRPNRVMFVNAVSIAINEFEQEKIDLSNKDAYDAFIKSRHLWTQMVSNFRLYLANQFASFRRDVLSRQEASITQMYEALSEAMRTIVVLDASAKLEFQASNSLQEMRISLRNWYNGFLAVKKIHHTDGWRVDEILIKAKIDPQMTKIQRLMIALSRDFQFSGLSDVNALTQAANKQSQFMWLVSICIITFFGGILFFFETLIIRPLGALSIAMKAVAFGEDGAALPKARVRETRKLLDAFNEMRKQLRVRQFELEHQSLHDSLTGLPNRTLLYDRLAQTVSSARQTNSEFCFLILDINRFKDINDTLGHHIGDNLLIETAIRIKSLLRESDTLARTGGDEFAILLPGCNAAYGKMLVDNIFRELRAIHSIANTQIYVSVSIGISIFPEHTKNAMDIYRNADIALTSAKKNQLDYVFYNDKDYDLNPPKLSLIGDLRDALLSDSLYLNYQPQVSFKNGQVNTVEALVRWQHPVVGRIPSEQIIEMAEQTGLINPLTHWVLNSAVSQCAEWHEQGLPMGMSVNISALNLQDEGLISQIRDCLIKYDIPNNCLTLEITESAMMVNPEAAMQVLLQLESMGLNLVIDDFGTGFSSLSYLKRLPVTKIKLDKSFVINLDSITSDEVIVRSTIEMAHNLMLEVVAEGVENQATWNLLTSLECDYAQGYYLTKPKSAEEIESWIHARGNETQFSQA